MYIHHLQDFQALHILSPRYLMALTPPTARRPEIACLVLENITFRLRIFCIHFVASSLEPITGSSTARPALKHLYVLVTGFWF